ncbi:hypothetical protein ANN_27988, partial [Periplaneta americana]
MMSDYSEEYVGQRHAFTSEVKFEEDPVSISSAVFKVNLSDKVWMTSSIFGSELRKWDRELTVKERKILLLGDNCPAHSHDENLSNIKLVFLPPNTTSQNTLINLLNAVRFANKVWRSMSAVAMQNCFRSPGLANGCVAFEEEDDVALHDLLQHITANTAADDFIDVDCEVITNEIPLDEAIVKDVKGGFTMEENEAEEDEDVNEERVTT